MMSPQKVQQENHKIGQHRTNQILQEMLSRKHQQAYLRKLVHFKIPWQHYWAQE
jgi:hypothetical protein